jgi:hypothetical protein
MRERGFLFFVWIVHVLSVQESIPATNLVDDRAGEDVYQGTQGQEADTDCERGCNIHT